MELAEVKYETLREWSARHGVTKAWAMKLCHQGRIDGAYKAGLVWVVPVDAPMPNRLTPGPVASLDSARAVNARAVAQRQAQREAIKAMPKVAVDPSKLAGRERWYYRLTRDPHFMVHGRWVFTRDESLEPDEVMGAAWMPDETEAQFRERELVFADWIAAGQPIDKMPADYKAFCDRDV